MFEWFSEILSSLSAVQIVPLLFAGLTSFVLSFRKSNKKVFRTELIKNNSKYLIVKNLSLKLAFSFGFVILGIGTKNFFSSAVFAIYFFFELITSIKNTVSKNTTVIVEEDGIEILGEKLLFKNADYCYIEDYSFNYIKGKNIIVMSLNPEQKSILIDKGFFTK